MKKPFLSTLRQTGRHVQALALLILTLLLGAYSVRAADIKLEGENASFRGVYVSTDQAGYSGTGYVWGFDNGSDSLVFTFPATAGKYDLVLQYYSPYGEKHCNLSVNGAPFTDQTLTNTGAGFGSVKVGQFQLVDGQNTIVINNGWGYYGIDYMALTPVADLPPVLVPIVNGKAEAENAVLNGVYVSTTPAGYSGTGQVVGFDNGADKITFNFNITPGLYEVTIGYQSPYGDKGYDLQVNEEKGGGMFTGTGSAYGTVNAGKFLLKDGLNTVIIGNGWGYFGIDYLLLTPSAAPLPVKPPKQLVDAQATSATRSLFSYMVDLYGNKVLSGQQGDVDYVLEKTGKEPAIGAFDLIDYSPSRREHGTNPDVAEKTIAWAKKGEGRGMLSIMWHWNAPTDLIDTVGAEWWRGFYTAATTFDLAAALADKNGERYHLLIRDIDSIATQLKKYQAAGIPLLWRPLHEAAGRWFWWGAKGPEPLKELWHIMYDRMTNYHQLHNLIWVYTATTDMNWYPGDAYVDIVGLDIYTDPSANMSGDWAAMQNLFGGKKLVTLSETGNLPIPAKVRGYATWWSWFSVWSGFIQNQPIDVLNAVYHDEDVITRDELPNWYVYGQANVAITQPTAQGNFYTCQTPVLKATATDADGSVTKVAFLVDGQVIGVDSVAQNGWEISWPRATIGSHTLTAKATDNEGITATSAPVSFTVKVDDQPPVLLVPAGIIANSNPVLCGALVKVDQATATDNCSAATVKGQRSDKFPLNAPYPIGTTTITWIATDAAGNKAQATQPIVVKDVTKPLLLVSPGQKLLWPANHQYVRVRVSDFVLGALDNCSGFLKPSAIRIAQVSSDEAENAPNSGNTTLDMVIANDCQSVQLRAERVNNGNGRVYTIQVEATDAAGNTSLAHYKVVVPPSPNQNAQADAVAYTVLGNCSSAHARMALDDETNAEEEEITVYPNPANGSYLNVSVYAATAQEARFSLVNSMVQEVENLHLHLKAGLNQVQIPLNNTVNGVYLLRVQKGQEQQTKKVIIAR